MANPPGSRSSNTPRSSTNGTQEEAATDGAAMTSPGTDWRSRAEEAEASVVELRKKVEASEARELAAWRDNADLRAQVKAKDVELEQLRSAGVVELRARLEVAERELEKRSTELKVERLKEISRGGSESFEDPDGVKLAGKGFRARALYNYKMEEDNEMDLKEDEIVEIDEMHPDGWWHATGDQGRKSGWIPSNYIHLLVKSENTSKPARDSPALPTPDAIPDSTKSSKGIPPRRPTEPLTGPANIFVSGYLGRTRLQWACSTGDLSLVKSYLSDGDDIDGQDDLGLTGLSYASRAGHLDVVRYLLSQNPDLHLHTTPGDHTAFTLACREGHLLIVKLLHEAGAPLFSYSGTTPLIEASSSGSINVVTYLLGEGAKVDAWDNLGWTSLHWAAKNNHLSVVSLLLSKGANKRTTTRAGKTPLDYAKCLGFGGGIATVTGTMYVAEISPKAVRGLMGALFSTNTLLGIAIGYWTNYGCILHVPETSHWQWRIPLLVQMIPGIFLVVFIPFIIESPRWLALHGRTNEAHAELAKLRRLPLDHDFVMQEYTDIVATIEEDMSQNVSWGGLYHAITSQATLRRRFILVMVVQIGFNFSGGNSITYFENAILTTIGITGTGPSLFAGIYGMMKLASSFFYAFVCAERFGRRIMLLFGAIVDIICVTYVAIYLGALNGQKAPGWVAVAALCTFAVGYGVGWSPVAFGLNGELFPNQFRAKIMSVCLTVQYLVNFLLVRFFTNITAGIGGKGPFIIFAVVSAAIVIYLFFALPETKGISLEHMDALFSGSWMTNGLRSHNLHEHAEAVEEEAFESFAEEPKPQARHIEGAVRV